MEMSTYVGFCNNMIAVTWVKIHWFNAISCCVKIWKCTQEYMSNNNPLYTCVYRTSFILKLPLLTVVFGHLSQQWPNDIIYRPYTYCCQRHVLPVLAAHIVVLKPKQSKGWSFDLAYIVVDNNTHESLQRMLSRDIFNLILKSNLIELYFSSIY